MPLISRKELKRMSGSLFEGMSQSKALNKASEILIEQSKAFSEEKVYDIFLSHRFLDANEILCIKEIFEKLGYSVYVDWIEDPILDRTKVTRETAEQIRTRMRTCRSLLFVTSTNSTDSKWMPWELGYFDGYKTKVAILPISESEEPEENYRGQEYLGLYPYVYKKIYDDGTSNIYIVFGKGAFFTLREWLPKDRKDKFMSFREYLKHNN